MPDYQNGKIYTIRCKLDSSQIYVGSTCETLCSRFSKHKYHWKHQASMPLYSYIQDFNDWYIELYEDFPCERREQLLKREGEICREIATLNFVKPGNYMTKGEQQYMKEYREQNAEQIKFCKQEHYKKNKETITAKGKEKYEQSGKEKILCECGIYSSKHHFSRNLKSVGHTKYLNSLNA